jgi:hypothetical protein
MVSYNKVITPGNSAEWTPSRIFPHYFPFVIFQADRNAFLSSHAELQSKNRLYKPISLRKFGGKALEKTEMNDRTSDSSQNRSGFFAYLTTGVSCDEQNRFFMTKKTLFGVLQLLSELKSVS